MIYRTAILSTALTLMAFMPTCDALAQLVGNAEAVSEWHNLPATEVAPVTDKQALRFAHSQSVDDGPHTMSGETLPDGTLLWTAGYRSAGAVSMSVIIKDIRLPRGGELCVMNGNGSVCKSIETHTDATVENQADGYTRIASVGSPRVPGQEIIVQYAGPAGREAHFRIVEVCNGFIDVDGYEPEENGLKTLKRTPGTYGSSEKCEMTASCLDVFEKERRAVCRLIVNNKYLGTGTLVNTTRQNREPIVMTSAHICGREKKIETCETLFGYEEPLCNGGKFYTKHTQQISGATLLAYCDTTDAAIIRLHERLTNDARPYWVGWSRAKALSGNLGVVHHPYGDAKKVSLSDNAAPNADYTGLTETNAPFVKNSFWYVARWAVGSTEGGSSGSALLNDEHMAVGALTGGYADCTKPEQDYFWMLCKAWDKASDGYKSPAQILDPVGQNVMSLGPLDMLSAESEPLNETANYGKGDTLAAEPMVIDAQTPSHSIRFAAASAPRKIWGVRVYNSGMTLSNTGDGGPALNAGVARTKGGRTETEEQRTFRSFKSNSTCDIVFPTAINIEAGTEFWIVIEGRNIGPNDRLKLAAAVPSGASADANAGIGTEPRIMASLLFADAVNAPNSLRQQHSAGLSLRRTESNLEISGEISGERLSSVVLYNRSGNAVKTVYANGAPCITLDLCGLNSGLYVAHTCTESGRQKSFKVIVK